MAEEGAPGLYEARATIAAAAWSAYADGSQLPPGTAGTRHVHDRVHDLPSWVLVRAAVPVRGGKQVPDQRPLLSGQIQGVKLLSCRPHPYPPGRTVQRSPLKHALNHFLTLNQSQIFILKTSRRLK